MSRRRRVSLRLALLLAAAGCGGDKAGGPPQMPPRPVEVLTIRPSPVRETGEYLGSLLSRGSVTVLPQVNGYVRKIAVKPGQRVAAGDVLVEIDAREENAALTSAGAQAASARAALALARKSLARAEALGNEGLVSAQEIDQRRADVAASEAALRAAGAEVSQRRVQLSYNAVKAPVPGLVGDVSVRIGDYVSATTPLTTVAKANALELTVSVPAARARGLQPGAPVEILDEDGKVLLTSEVFFVAAEADPKTQLVEVKATFENTVGLRPNELVRVRVVYKTSEAMTLPVLAVQRQSGQSFALVVVERDGQTVVERRPVVLGPIGEGGYRIESGLAAGDRVALSSLQMLREGQPVVVQAPAAAQPPPAEQPAGKAAR
jgi:RND family efflux transporter MFP subunit